MLRQEIQGGAAARHAKRLALWAELARPRHLSALHPRHRLRAPGYSPVRSPRSRHQRGRARQHPRRGKGACQATAAIRARLLDGTILQSDETGLRVGKQNWWLWVFHHDDSALFVAAPSRAKKVVADFLGDFRPDFWVSDRYGGQMGWATVNNQVCLAHLIRDVQYAIDAGDDIFAPELRHLLGRACRIGRRRERLADTTLKTYAARLYARLDELMRLVPAHEAGVKLQRVIKRTSQYLFVFVTNRDIPATNNGSERALRPCAVFRKITNGFRTQWGAELYADIRSIVETGRRRAISALDAIRLTLAGKPLPIGA